MKAARVMLRWYKSFNTSYAPYADRKSGVELRPWNEHGVPQGTANDNQFIEIPLEREITTIVGANESGKSHLISAISKVVNGIGIPDAEGHAEPY